MKSQLSLLIVFHFMVSLIAEECDTHRNATCHWDFYECASHLADECEWYERKTDLCGCYAKYAMCLDVAYCLDMNTTLKIEEAFTRLSCQGPFTPRNNPPKESTTQSSFSPYIDLFGLTLTVLIFVTVTGGFSSYVQRKLFLKKLRFTHRSTISEDIDVMDFGIPLASTPLSVYPKMKEIERILRYIKTSPDHNTVHSIVVFNRGMPIVHFKKQPYVVEDYALVVDVNVLTDIRVKWIQAMLQFHTLVWCLIIFYSIKH